MKKTILITGIGGPTPRSIAHFIKNSISGIRIIGVDSNPKAVSFYSTEFVHSHQLIPKAGDAAYFEVINEIIEIENIDLAFVQPEMEILVWGKYFIENRRYPCNVLLPPYQHSSMLINKANMSELLKETNYIPRTIVVRNDEGKPIITDEIQFPCWIRASVGSGGLGSLKLDRMEDLEAWLFIHKEVKEFTVSDYLPGRHLANQMLYIEGKCMKNAALHCAEYVMADIAPSKVTGNTAYGIMINDDSILEFCENVMDYISEKTNTPAHGTYSFDLKEDAYGQPMVTEINVRHMAYTGIMAEVGFDLISDSIHYCLGDMDNIKIGRHSFDKNYVFLRDVDIKPIITEQSKIL